MRSPIGSATVPAIAPPDWAAADDATINAPTKTTRLRKGTNHGRADDRAMSDASTGK
jgi:hypothetical protein